MSNKYTSPNDASFHRIEELRHQRHAEIREQARAGDGTIEAGEAEADRIRAIHYRREAARLRDALRDALEQKQEARS